LLEERFKKKAGVQWLSILRAHGIPCGEYFEGRPRTHVVIDHPQVKANDMMATLETPWGPGNVATGHWQFSKNSTSITRPAPKLDEHHAEILAELGLDTRQPDLVGAKP
jgi:crotonobetainyl-CoA:carnitine CoA-transferase CaiB-like acyl-CoA transferase